MRFSQRKKPSQIPEINLVTMIDVLMSVLTFFIIISMTLTGQQVLDVVLPNSSTPADTKTKTQPQGEALVVGLNLQGQIILDNQPVNNQVLADRIQTYLNQNPQGKIILSADRQLPYPKVATALKQMGKMGGNSVSLLLQDQ